MSFGKRLKQARRAKKLTQPDVASLIGVDFTTISKWENGHVEPGREQIVKLASLYGVSTEYLMGSVAEKEEVEEAIKSRDIEEVLELYRDELTFRGQKISDEEIKKMLQVLKWIYEAKGES